jgi:hypothetical protein
MTKSIRILERAIGIQNGIALALSKPQPLPDFVRNLT